MEETLSPGSIAAAASKAQTLLSCCRYVDSKKPYPDLAVQLDRFNHWARNIGVFAPQHASLDYRLRTEPTVKVAVNAGLDALCGDIMSGLLGGRECTEEELEGFYSLTDASVGDFALKLLRKSELKPEETSAAQAAVFDSVAQKITTLHRFSLSIRRASNRNTLGKGKSLVDRDQSFNWYNDDKSGNIIEMRVEAVRFDITGAYHDYVMRVLESRWLESEGSKFRICERMRNYRQCLLRRCADGITARRRQMAYFRTHQAKIERQSLPILKPNSKAPPELKDSVGDRNVTLSSSPLPQPRILETPATMTTSGTTPSKFNMSQFSPPKPPSVGASTSAASSEVLTVRDHGKFEIPLAPSVMPWEREKMCPYCCLVLPAKTFQTNEDSRRWKRHLKEDLEPYVCLYEECSAPNRTYRKFTEWRAHMEQRHNTTDINIACCAESDIIPMTMDTNKMSDQGQDRHFPENVPPLEVLHFSALRCFVCFKSMTDPSSLWAHVAKHLKCAFLIALPWRDDVDIDTDASSNTSSVLRHRLSDEKVLRSDNTREEPMSSMDQKMPDAPSQGSDLESIAPKIPSPTAGDFATGLAQLNSGSTIFDHNFDTVEKWRASTKLSKSPIDTKEVQRLTTSANESLTTGRGTWSLHHDRQTPPGDLFRDFKRQKTIHDVAIARPNQPRDPSSRPHEEYTIAWICALHIEMAAAEAMLDELHDSLPTHVDDNNTYTLGRIHKHNVVISCLPTGYYGTINAATVISNLMRSFPSIRAGLMVGIGGGVPSKADLRLGDVVVGTRVMQCDMGKTIESGQLQRTAIARIPSQLLCTAVSTLRAKQERDSTSIMSIVAHKFVEHSGYHRPNLPDDLFLPTYDHEPSNLDCNQCDRTKLEPRRQRSQPAIHYGAIASGNQVMRSALQRDIIGQELDVICFEMEAAGVMDIIPCLPIRGICDYSDSHKNKSWQRYAAATAAAFATELLAVLPSSENHETLAFTSRTESGPPEDRCQELLKLLDFDQKGSRQFSIQTAHRKTCRWLLSHPDYEAWLDPGRLLQHHGLLLIRGKPGSGKSTVMKFAYGNMRRDRRQNGTSAAFFFNARGSDVEKSVSGMYRSLLSQLLQGVPEVQSVVNIPDFGYQDLKECLQLENLKEIFWSAVLALGQEPFTCFIDALDECDEQQVMDLVRFFEELATQTTEQNIKFRVCFSSRHYPYIFVPGSINIILEDQQGHTEDLAGFIDSRLRIHDSALRSQLQSDIFQKASGVFLWVSLVVDILNHQDARGGMDLRKRLRNTPDDLHQLFKDMLRRDERNKESLLLCILWILCAKRPLNPSEFSHAIWSGLLMNGQADGEPPNLMRADGSSAADRFVIGASKGLAEVSRNGEPRVQFIHESVRDFLLKDGGLRELWPDLGYDWQVRAHERLKECCSCYLGYRPLQSLVSQLVDNPSVISKDRAREQYPFLDYASQHILGHADIAEEAIAQQDFLSRFPIRSWIAISNHFQKHQSRQYTANANILYVLADRGVSNLIRRWLNANPKTDVFEKKERFRYPLFAALANGNKSSVAALLNISTTIQDDVDITEGLNCIKDLERYQGRTPLSWASQEGRLGLVRLLLQNGAPPSENDGEGRTALSRASQSGQGKIVKVLLEHGAHVNAADLSTPESFPIFWASTEETVQYLIDSGADANVRTSNGSTVLHHMSEMGNETGIRALFTRVKDMRDNINVTNTYGSSPLVNATTEGHEAVAKLLIQLGADVNTGHSTLGNGALIQAIIMGHQNLVELFIQHNADLNARSRDGDTPILVALKRERMAAVERLVDAGVDLLSAISGDPEVWEAVQDNVLMWASEFGHAWMVEVLFKNNSYASISFTIKDTALKMALFKGHTAIVDILESFGAVEGPRGDNGSEIGS